MLGWPGSDWSAAPAPAPPIEADWTILPEEARHTFTHFHLRLSIEIARTEPGQDPTFGMFLPQKQFKPSELPTVMRKVFDLAHGALGKMG